MEKYAFNFRKTVEGKSLHISDQPVLLSEFQDNPGYVDKSYLKLNNNNDRKEKMD